MSTKRLTHEEFIKRVYENRGKTIEVVGIYEGINTIIKVRCLECNDSSNWYINARDLITRGYCKHKRLNNKSTLWYKEKVEIAHKNSIIVTGEYVNARTKIPHKCVNCSCGFGKEWESLPQNVLKSNGGCPKKYRFSESIKANKDRYDKCAQEAGFYLLDAFVTHEATPILRHKCIKCGSVELRSTKAILNGKPNKYCRNCNSWRYKTGYSQIAIEWLETLAKAENIYIQHAENDGEYYIPGYNIRVDGYCRENNTVYEFLGDVFHGNIKIYDCDKRCNPYKRSKSALDLHFDTFQRIKLIRSLGYTVHYIWERDYRDALFHMQKASSRNRYSPRYSASIRG